MWLRIMKYLSTPGRAVTWDEFSEFWDSLTVEEKRWLVSEARWN